MFVTKKRLSVGLCKLTEAIGIEHGKQIAKLKDDFSNSIDQKMSVFRDQVIKKDDELMNRVSKLESIVKALCLCKDFTLLQYSKEDIVKKHYTIHFDRDTPLPDVPFDIHGGRISMYNKKCSLCGKLTPISKKEYLTHQKETIESSLKGCE